MRRTVRPEAVRRTAAATIVVLALGGLTACNDDTDSTATDESPASATPTTSESPSDSASPAPTAGETVDPATFLDDVLGAMTDLSTAHLSMKVEGGPAQMTMEGDVDYTTTPPEMAMTMDYPMFGKGDIEMRMVGGDMYMQIPMMSSGKWIKMPLTDKDSPLSGNLLDQMNPGTAMEAMKGAVDEVTYVGDEDVDGESLHHYTMKVRSAAFQKLQDELGGTGAADLPSVISYDVWIDNDNRVRQMKMSMGDLGAVTMTMSDWGEPVQIEAPPASEVTQMPGGLSMMS